VTTLVIPEVNDSDAELRGIAGFLASVGAEMPWHVSQFYPAYKMLNAPVTPVATLRRAVEIGKAAGLRYVYAGNVPGEQGENTWCYACGTLLIERFGYRVRANRIVGGKCPECSAAIDGVGMSPVARARQVH
jgi:pyruvate formate lyase activating enzyme